MARLNVCPEASRHHDTLLFDLRFKAKTCGEASEVGYGKQRSVFAECPVVCRLSWSKHVSAVSGAGDFTFQLCR